MKVKLIGYKTLENAIEMEGDTIVEEGEDLLLNEEIEGSIPNVIIEALGITLEKGKEFYTLTKFFTGDWSSQTFISFSLPTLMNGNIGCEIESGRAGRYVLATRHADIFSSLKDILKEMNYSGFISLKFNDDDVLIDISFGAGLSLYCILEGVKGKISDFFMSGTGILESWSVALRLTRFPYPHKETAERLYLKLPLSIEKHVWFKDLNRYKKNSYTDKTDIAVVSAWATSLNEAARRVYRTCQSLEIPLKQYRTDIADTVSNQWTKYLTLTEG